MDSIVALNIGYQKALLIRPIQVPDIPQPVECRGGVAEDVAGGGEAFGLGGVDHGHVFGDDLLGVVVEFHAHFVVGFLAGLDVEVVDQGFPLGGGFRLLVGYQRWRGPRCCARWLMPPYGSVPPVKPMTMASQS